MSLRVLLVGTGILPVPPEKGGAIELHTYHLAKELARLGYEVHYVSNTNQSASFPPELVLHRIPSLPFSFQGAFPSTMLSYATGGFLASLKALGAARKSQFNIVHCHGNTSARFIFALMNGTVRVFTIHNPSPWILVSSSQLQQTLRLMTFKSLDLGIIRDAEGLITVSKFLKNELIARWEIDPQKIRVIPNGVDTERFKPSVPGSKRLREKYGLDEDFALFIGRLVEQKGVRFLIEAIAGTKLHVVIVGGGPLMHSLKDLSRRLGVGDQLHFVGAVSSQELPKFYAEASVFVIPSLAEGLPLVGLEAMSAGLPLIGSQIPGIDEIIEDERNGFLVRPMDVPSLRSRLVQTFEDGSLRKTLGYHSREIAEAQYSWRRIAKLTCQFYMELIS